ncbi:MAG: hypothetical protein J6S91_07380, partial [Treponema sp.]|nr:hypothetical protein [Treponema sp.]
MKKILCTLMMTSALLVSAFALNVDEVELKVPGSVDAVQFENYGGPHAHIDTADAIVNIGAELGRDVAADLEKSEYYRPNAKYSLIHVVDPSVTEGRDADILVLNETAGVDHIKNLRRIVTGFLQAAYNYNREDAEVIATYVTVYNAVYRQQIQVFQERYKPAVLEYLDADKVGLSTNWEDWAGKTQIVIPLNDVNAGISVVDTTTITDENVVEALRQEEDKAIDLREDMTDLKQREATSATEKAQEAQKDATVQRNAGNTEQAAQSAKTATTQQQIADRKNIEVRNDTAAIVEDKNILNGTTVAEVDNTNNVTGLFVVDESRSLYTLITVNGMTGEVIRRSPVKQIKGKLVYIVDNITVVQDGETASYDKMFLTVCGVNDGHSATRLCLIDSDKLELRKQSDQILSDTTEFLRSGDSYFVVVSASDGYHAAVFDKNLNMLRQ